MTKFLAILCFPGILLAQDLASGSGATSPVSTGWVYPGYHRHDGFYLSMNLGPALGGTINKFDDGSTSGKIIYRGPGAFVDLKVGGAIQENTILSFDLIGRTITGPDVEYNGQTQSATDDFSMTDNSYGLGLTHYFMPANTFVSATVGTGKMSYKDKSNDTEGESKWGFALHLKVGKEWWVSPNWGLGVSGGYGFMAANDKVPAGSGITSTLTSHQFYILFNTTYN